MIIEQNEKPIRQRVLEHIWKVSICTRSDLAQQFGEDGLDEALEHAESTGEITSAAVLDVEYCIPGL